MKKWKKRIEELEQKIEYYKGAFKLEPSYSSQDLKINVNVERFKDLIQKLLDNSIWKDTHILEPKYGWEWTIFDFIVRNLKKLKRRRRLITMLNNKVRLTVKEQEKYCDVIRYQIEVHLNVSEIVATIENIIDCKRSFRVTEDMIGYLVQLFHKVLLNDLTQDELNLLKSLEKEYFTLACQCPYSCGRPQC